MHDDKLVLAVFKAKTPQRVYCKPGESYDVARARYRARLAAWRDAYCMAWCNVYKGKTLRAFYGIEMQFIKEI